MIEDAQLLQEYAQGSEPAFRELVDRYVGLVYSAALRHLPDPQLAEDVVQTVFIAFARKARALPSNVILGGWLYRHTCFVASQARRTEYRRQAREQQAATMNHPTPDDQPDWERLAPLLDEAMQSLAAADRDAVVLRYFQRWELRRVAEALGTGEDAVRKRIGRALDKLRAFFAHRGVTLSAAALASLLSAHAVAAVPAGLAAATAAGALAAAASAGAGTTLTTLEIMTISKMKIAVLGALAVAAVVTPLAMRHHARVESERADATLRQQAARQAELQDENRRLAAQAQSASAGSASASDLQRLRGEAAGLRRQTNDLAGLRQTNRRLQAAANLPEVEPTEEQQQVLNAQMTFGKQQFIASAIFSRTNQGNFPARFEQLASYFARSTNNASEPMELVYTGSFKSLMTQDRPQDLIVLRQKEVAPYGNRWAKVYGYGDGHFEVHSQADRDFSAWEEQHRVQAAAK
jgi:RNA polymerase sigma factor (sigma-70 family)